MLADGGKAHTEMRRDVIAFGQKPQRSRSRRVTVVCIDPTISEVVVEQPSGERITAAMDPRDVTEALCRLANASDESVWVECEVSGGVITQFFLVAEEELVQQALQRGSWNVEEDVITVCKAIWRDGRVAYRKDDAIDEEVPASTLCDLWNDAYPLFPHQAMTVTWMRGMESTFPQTIHYDGNLRITPEWFIDTENECFTTDASPRTATLMGGICADGMGKGKTASALRLVVEEKRRAGGSRTREPYESDGTLILLPVNLVGQWRREMQKFLDTAAVTILFVLQGRNLPSMKELLRADIVVTTFHFLRNNKTYNEMVDKCLKGRAKERASLGAWVRTPDHNECLVEAVTWRRVVIDEMHQTFERMADMRHVRLLRCRALWGLTATPVLENDQAQHLYALLTREKTHHPNLLSRLIGRCVRISEATSLETLSNRSLCMVSLSAEERILLGDVDGDTLADKVRKITFVDYSPHARETLETQMTAARRRECDTARAKVLGHERSVRLLEQVGHELEREHERIRAAEPGSDMERAAGAAYAAHMEDVKVARNMLLRQTMLLREKEGMENELQHRVQRMRDVVSCHSCETTRGKLLLVSNCMHILCSQCLGIHRICGACGDMIQDVAAVDTSRGIGTKMREIASLVESFGDAPSILFVQWKSMMKGTRSFLRSRDVRVHTLDGNATQRSNTLQCLSEGGVLLLCLEDGFAGLHLPHVSHVIFAHAIVGDRDRVLTLESQAIARCVRYGQTNDVSTYSFVVADTDEEALYEMTHREE